MPFSKHGNRSVGPESCDLITLRWDNELMRKNGDFGVSGDEKLPDPEVPIRLATFDQYRSLLFSVAYRMLGTIADAEDMLQETFIRWQQATDEDIRSPRAFLVTIISRLCINHLQSARVQREEYPGPVAARTDYDRCRKRSARAHPRRRIAFHGVPCVTRASDPS